MEKTIEAVKEFHTVFGHPILPIKEEIKPERAILRLCLLLEELYELASAYGLKSYFIGMCNTIASKDSGVVPDRVAQLDALVDLQYVLNGAVLESGFAEVWDEANAEVHRSNMSKTLSYEELAIIEKNIYNHFVVEEEYQVNVKEIKGRFILSRNIDGKIIKPSTYSLPDLKSILNTKLEE